MDNKIKKLIVFTFPYVGHTNPVLGFCKQLKTNYSHIKTIVYSTTNFKNLIEESGGEFREYPAKFPDTSDETSTVNDLTPIKIGLITIDLANKMAEILCQEVLKEQTDMIMYDKSSLYGKLIIDKILIKYKSKQLKPFKIIGYSTTLQIDREYPNKEERKKLLKFKLIDIFWLLLFMFKKFIFYLKLGVFRNCRLITTYDPLENEKTIVFTFPQFQPRYELRDKNIFKFVGCSFDEKLHSSGRGDHSDSFKIIEKFPVKTNNLVNADYDLIYVAFGSVLTNQLNVYLKIINGLKLVNEEKKIKVIISTGNKCYDYLNTSENEIPNFVYLVRSAPQIEVLKRASLFITHNGMNSTSESIHYGVPMICMPMTTDQPLVAYRVSNDLKLGLMLNYKTFEIIDLKKAVLEILNDKSYLSRCQIYMNYSRSYDGIKNAAKIINEFI